MKFSDIIGHTKIKEKLINTVTNNRISHAQLFLGPEGNGKLSMAIAYAQYVSCINKTDGDACGTCKSCKKYNKLIHPDLHFVFPVVGPKNVSDNFIHKWREFVLESNYHGYNNWINFIGADNKQGNIYSGESQQIIKKLNLKTFESEYKVMLIWMAEKMNNSAANKLLKMIEEPPPKTLFILVSEDDEQIISTIRSRTQLIKIPQLTEADIIQVFEKQDNNSDKELIKDIARISKGNFINAAKTLNDTNNSSENTQNYELFTQLMRLTYGAKIVELIAWVDEIAKIGRERQKDFLDYSLRMIRENFILNIMPEEKNISYLAKKEYEFSVKFNTFINKKNTNELFYEFNKAHSDIMRNAYNKIVFLDLALKITKLLKK